MRFSGMGLAFVLLGACGAPPSETQPPSPAVDMTAGLRVVGEPEVGAQLMASMKADGIAAVGRFEGRAKGLDTYCAGSADILVIGADLTETERQTCKAAGGTWSAISGIGNNAPILLIDPDLAEIFIARSALYQ